MSNVYYIHKKCKGGKYTEIFKTYNKFLQFFSGPVTCMLVTVCSFQMNKAFNKLIPSLKGVVDNPMAMLTQSGLAPGIHNFFPSDTCDKRSPNQHPLGIKNKICGLN